MIFDSRFNSFFALESAPSLGPLLGAYTPKVSGPPISATDLISISVTEEMGKSVYGQISLNDPTSLYARFLKNNTNLYLSWGYKALGASLLMSLGQLSPDVFKGNIQRRGLNVFVTNPSGRGDDKGVVTFNCGFMSMGWIGEAKIATFSAGTKMSVIMSAFSAMGVSPDKQKVQFDNLNDSYSSESFERQEESDFQFVARLALEWRCMFRLGYANDGTVFGIFIDHTAIVIVQEQLQLWTGGLIEGGFVFSYGKTEIGETPIISYEWRNAEGESGQGDYVKAVMMPNGQYSWQRFTMKTDSVSTRVIDTEKAASKATEEQAIAVAGAAVGDINNTAYKPFWNTVTMKTAPNGLGYTINLRCFGLPQITCGMIVQLNHGFPDIFRERTDKSLLFLVQSVTHTVDQSGYFTDLSIVDLATVSLLGIL